MSSPQNNDQRSSADACHLQQDATAYTSVILAHRQQHQQQQQHMLHMQQQQHMHNLQKHENNQKSHDSEMPSQPKRKLYSIQEQLETEEEREDNTVAASEALDVAYDADVDDDVPMKSAVASSGEHDADATGKTDIILDDRQHIYELFQPWALKTYGDLAKTKTITMRKKVRILKALEGKEHSRPDSSKFRFWVKTKGFTTKRPERFEDAPCTQRYKRPLPPNAVLSDNAADVDLYVASSTKDLEKRTYRKVAVVEEFFDIIFQIHMELGGRSGTHAGQKRTYRIISETYAFLPREAVTRFLSICPECKKNLRPSSPSAANVKDELAVENQNESSSEFEVLNYSSHTESSLEAGPTAKTSTKTTLRATTQSQPKKRRYSNPDNNSKAFVSSTEQTDPNQSLPRRNSSPLIATPAVHPTQAAQVQLPKIRVNPHLQRPFTPPLTETSAYAQPHYGFGFDFHSLKSRDNFVRYYDFMRRLYSGNLIMPHSTLATNVQHPAKSEQHVVNSPTTVNSPKIAKKSAAKTFEPSVPSSSSDDEGDHVTVLAAKRFKTSPSSSDKTKALELPPTQLQIPAIDKDFIQSTQIRAINLSKNSSHFSSHLKIATENLTTVNTTPAGKQSMDAPASSTPIAGKQGNLTPPKTSALSASLRMPQLRTITGLPPLDFERLKPITSTYLQLTRSMGLSDEEALRFDNLVSKDFKYSL